MLSFACGDVQTTCSIRKSVFNALEMRISKHKFFKNFVNTEVENF